MARLFGTDGVRGIANVELTPELAFKLGRAAASYFGRETRNPKIIIGRDTRLSGTMLEAALAAGICSAGGNAHLLGNELAHQGNNHIGQGENKNNSRTHSKTIIG